MNVLPGALMHTRPFLCVQRAFVLMLTNQSEAAEELLQQAEQLVQEETPTEHVRTIYGPS
jgi:ATP/maltotriose-dependent transcriptional regulator MalT